MNDERQTDFAVPHVTVFFFKIKLRSLLIILSMLVVCLADFGQILGCIFGERLFITYV